MFFQLFTFQFLVVFVSAQNSYFQKEFRELSESYEFDKIDESCDCGGEKTPLKASKNKAKSKFPKIHRRMGLNRFHFLRYCDTPETLAEVIYGDKSMANKLRKWNPRVKWQAGDTIYFRSPVRNASNKLMNLFDEHPGRIEKYVVKRGDNLQKIAEKMLGDFRNWKDLAFLNNIQSPDELYAGQRLTLKFLR